MESAVLQNTESLLLTCLIFSPLIGLLIVAFLPRESKGALQGTAILLSLLPVVLSLTLFSWFDRSSEVLQFVEHYAWFTIPLPEMGGQPAGLSLFYTLGVDGLSLAMLVMSSVVVVMAAIAGRYLERRWKEFYLWLFALEIGMLGVFAAQNLFLFFVFFELTIIAIFFMVGQWGERERESAANQFLLYNGIGSGIMLLVFVFLFVRFGTLDYAQLSAYLLDPDSPYMSSAYALGEGAKLLLFFALLVAFGIKLPIFPLHRWMIKVNQEAHPAVLMLESGIVLKMGAYGILRFGLGLFPEQAKQMAVLLAVLGLVNLLFGAFAALIQTDLRLILAYSSLSHMGIVLLGIAAMNEAGFQGSLFQMVSHGFVSPLLFFLLLVWLSRTGSTRLEELGGLGRSMPRAAGFFMAAAMASLGLPTLSGFVSEFFAFTGLFGSLPIFAAVGTLGIILTAAYMLRAVQGVTFGPMREQSEGLLDVRGLEYVPLLVLLAFSLLIGLYPAILAEPLQNSLQDFLLRIGG